MPEPPNGTFHIVNTPNLSFLATTPQALLPFINNEQPSDTNQPVPNSFLGDDDIFHLQVNNVADFDTKNGTRFILTIAQDSESYGQIIVEYDSKSKDWVVDRSSLIGLLVNGQLILDVVEACERCPPVGYTGTEEWNAVPRWSLLAANPDAFAPTDEDLSQALLQFQALSVEQQAAIAEAAGVTLGINAATLGQRTMNTIGGEEFHDAEEYIPAPYDITLHSAHTLHTVTASTQRAMRFLPGVDKIVNWIRGQLNQAQDNIHMGRLADATVNLFSHFSKHASLWDALKIFSQLFFGEGLDYEPGTKTQIEDVPDCFVYTKSRVENWGTTVSQPASYVFVPSTTQNIIDIVKFAKEQEKSVRVTGYTHTWSEFYINPDQISIAMIPPSMTRSETLLNNVHTNYDLNITDELHKIEWENAKEIEDGQYALLRMGAGARNFDFLNGCHERQFKYTIPFNVIMTEITFGGSNSLLCHGSGITSSVVCDLVHVIEFVDFDGNVRVLSRDNPEDASIMNSACGAFGLFGVITHLTMKIPKMTIARYSPYLIDYRIAIPAPGDTDETYPGVKEGIARLKVDMNKYYSEWFWFPLQDNVWVNCYDNKPINFPTPISSTDSPEAQRQKQEAKLAIEDLYDRNIVTYSDRFYGNLTSTGHVFARLMDPHCPDCAKAMGQFATAGVPTFAQEFPTIGRSTREKKQTKDVILIEAVHFRRGIHGMPVRDMEAEIKLPDPENGNDDKAVNMMRELWWAGINITQDFQSKSKSPLTMALEMRITGGAAATLAAQRGNNRTASIEVLSITGVDETVWYEFCLALWDRWEVIAIKYNQDNTTVKPHWAKEWNMLTDKNGLDLDQLFGPQFQEFINDLEIFAQRGRPGVTARDYFKLFGNNRMYSMFEKYLPKEKKD